MSNSFKANLLSALEQRLGSLRSLPGSTSLFALNNDQVRVYLRYSRVHDGRRAFFGLRISDLRVLEGYNSYICLFTDSGLDPVLIPLADFQELFLGASPAADGQIKAQVLFSSGQTELYVARCGRYNVDGYLGFHLLDRQSDTQDPEISFSHASVQAMIAAIGLYKGFDVYVPPEDQLKFDPKIIESLSTRHELPRKWSRDNASLPEIDVVWLSRSRGEIDSVFEVEHSTTIYSGLLRFNDLLLANPQIPRFTVVADDTRRNVFARQLFRPTFRHSGLAEVTNFMRYENVYHWYKLAKVREPVASLKAHS